MSQPQLEANGSDQFPDVEAARASRGFLSVIWQRKALVILGTMLGLIAGALVYWQRPAVYRADAQIHVIKRHSPMDGKDGPQLSGYEDFIATHIVLLRSPHIVARAIKKKDLDSLKTLEGTGDPVGQILTSLSVGRDKSADSGGSSNILLLSYRGPVADDCSKIVSAIIDAYQEYLDQKYRLVSDETLALIMKARDIIKSDLKDAEIALDKFRHGTSLYITNKEGLNSQLDTLFRLEKTRIEEAVQVVRLKNRIDEFEAALAKGKDAQKGKNADNEALLEIIRASSDAKTASPKKMMDDQLLPLKLRESELLRKFGEESPSVLAVRDQMKAVQDHFEKSVGSGVEDRDPVKLHILMLKIQLREAEKNVKSHEIQVEDAKKNAKDLSANAMEEEHLRRDVAHANDVLQNAISRLTQLNLTRDQVGYDAQKLSESPGYKVAPSAFQMIVAGLMGGLLIGIGLAFLADFTDKSFRNPDEVRVRLGLPLLGHVPFLQADPEAAKKVQAGEIAIDPMLLSLFRPKSLEAEAYRAVRTAVFFSVQGEGHRVLQVSSPNKGDGKSLMVSNLAISMAQSGKKVLVIDADCRRPRQHKIFGLENTQGLSSVLAHGGDWRSAIHVTPVDGLWIMPSGPIPPNPSELLSSPRFAQVLEAARPDFDYVLVDTPPLLAVTDPCVVAGHVDGLVLILRLSRQGRPHAERARQILTQLGVKILGVVVNGVTRQSGTGIYSSEHYDYTESYEQTPEAEDNDGYYYHDEDTPEAPAKK